MRKDKGERNGEMKKENKASFKAGDTLYAAAMKAGCWVNEKVLEVEYIVCAKTKKDLEAVMTDHFHEYDPTRTRRVVLTPADQRKRQGDEIQ